MAGSLLSRLEHVPTANGSELIPGAWNQFAQNIVCGIAFCAAFLDRIDNQIRGSTSQYPLTVRNRFGIDYPQTNVDC
jgi:hypothetical protein